MRQGKVQRAKYTLIIEKVSCYEYKKNLNCSPQRNLWQKSNPCLSKPLCVNFVHFERFQCVCVCMFWSLVSKTNNSDYPHLRVVIPPAKQGPKFSFDSSPFYAMGRTTLTGDNTEAQVLWGLLRLEVDWFGKFLKRSVRYLTLLSAGGIHVHKCYLLLWCSEGGG